MPAEETPPEVSVESAAEAFLLRLRTHGIRHFLVNAGTDFAPIVEAYARLNSEGDLLPEPILAAHENVVMGMAHGAYLVTQAPQAVMFHVNVGTANAACGIMNAASENVPVLVCAGRSPIHEAGQLGARNTRVAWAQEMSDQGALVRGQVKWEYELRAASQICAVVDRALGIAMTEPRGPVYVTFPREVLAAPLNYSSANQMAWPSEGEANRSSIDRLADVLARAAFPVISSLASGADPETVQMLERICDRYAIGYAEEQARYLNFPSNHPLHLGYNLSPVFEQADALLFVESDVPWVPDISAPKAQAFVAQAGTTPSFDRIPMRTHRCDISIKAGAKALFNALDSALEARRQAIDYGRRQRLVEFAERRRTNLHVELRREISAEGPITTDYLSMILGQLLHDNCILFNEYWVSRTYINLSRPGSYFFLPATGGLGFGLPAALGAKLNKPNRTVIAAVGDGTYMFANPVACHHASRKHNLPVLTIIANNTRWNAVDLTARMVYPNGHLTKHGWHGLSDLRPSVDFEKICAASDGYGATVSDRADLKRVLEEAMAVVEVEGRQAVVDVRCS